MSIEKKGQKRERSCRTNIYVYVENSSPDLDAVHLNRTAGAERLQEKKLGENVSKLKTHD